MTTSLLLACSGPDAESDSSKQLGADDSLFTIAEPGFEMQLILSKTKLALESVNIEFNDMQGFLEIEMGEYFRLEMIDDSLDVEVIKDELSNHPLFTYDIVDHGNSAFVYHAILPNGQEHSRHFVELKNIDDGYYLVRTAQNGQFNENQIKEMRKAIDSMSPIQ
jgi:hypothetical protein